jgi:hypothetical protein
MEACRARIICIGKDANDGVIKQNVDSKSNGSKSLIMLTNKLLQLFGSFIWII